MRATPLACALWGVALALTACSKQEAQRNSAGERPASMAATQPQVAQKAVSPADKAAKNKSLNEDGTETVEDNAGDSGTHNSLLAAVASTVTAAANAATPLNGTAVWQEGVNYARLVPAQPTDAPPGQIEVLEFFWYGCPHCYALEPTIEAWDKAKPAYVTLTRVPVLWNEGDRSLARLYYTVQSLGKIGEMHAAIFKEIHVNNDPLIGSDPGNTAEAERIQIVFAQRFGITDQAFRGKFEHDMGVDTAMQHADQLIQRYRVSSVPDFVVNGKFIADVASAGSPEKLISLLNDLIAAEHKRQP
jgi:protein dithiol oxidoreductase (disulfide-forming)